MGRIVMKFGGTSMGDSTRIKSAAKRVAKEVQAGNQVCVVVSAMAGTTNDLIEKINSISPVYNAQEYDSVVSAGEQISAGLMAIALQDMTVKARSWLGWQAGIHTTDAFSRARILDIIPPQDFMESLENGTVAVMAGFQGLNSDLNRITTLGRGGSDTSAVALAVAIKADRCDIYTDVDGVYTADPRIVKNARKLDIISHEEMLELASLGSKVLQTRSVEIAMHYNMPLRVLSSFDDTPGTLIAHEDKVMEKEIVVGVTATKDEAQISLSKIKDCPGAVARVFAPITDNNINVDMIIQTTSQDGKTTDITFTIPEGDLERTLSVLKQEKDTIGYNAIAFNSNIAKVSVVGIGMRSHAGVAQKMFSTLGDKSINILDISTSEIKISVLIEKDYVELAVRSLHQVYDLDA